MLCLICGHDTTTPQAIACRACGTPFAGTAPAPHVLAPGSLLLEQTYSVGKVLGQGGFGITYLGSDTRLRRPVAIKEFFPAGCVRQSTTVVPAGAWTPETYVEARQRFVQEGQALGRFKHAGIVQVHAAFEANNTAYLVMEYVRGQTLAALLIERGGRLDEAETLTYVQRVAEALEVVHAAGLLHRDIKPDNLMIGPDGRVVLLDFGTAREFSAGQTQRHSVLITPGYAPLEQYAQQAQRGPYTDVYALAATTYHLLTGVLPVAATDRAAGVELPPVHKLRPEVSAVVAEAVMAGLAMRADARPASVRAWLERLQGVARQPASRPMVVPAPSPVALQPEALAPRWENSIGLRMVRIPAGEFLMGTKGGWFFDSSPSDEKPQHRVRFTRAVYVGIYPVTQRQWQAVMNGNPSRFPRAEHPVGQASWYDAVVFCNTLSTREGLQPCYAITNIQQVRDSIRAAAVVCNPGATGYRLPTEAEWEYAARAGSAAAYCYGDSTRELQRYAWYARNSGSNIHPVGTLQPNAWGLYDVHGNVWEWVQDSYDGEVYKRRAAAEAAAVDPCVLPADPAAALRRVHRGGGFDNDAGACRAANRRPTGPTYLYGPVGFRLLREAP